MKQILETDRLILRTWSEDDLIPMLYINQDPKVCEFLPGLGNLLTTQAMLDRFINHFNAFQFSIYAVELKKTSEMIGFLGLIPPSFESHFTPAIEIGWRLASQHWNNGYATEGAKTVLHYAFTQLNLDEIVSFTVINNLASRRVMQKIGLHHNPQDDFDHPMLEQDSPLKPHVLYRLNRSDYLHQLEFKS